MIEILYHFLLGDVNHFFPSPRSYLVFTLLSRAVLSRLPLARRLPSLLNATLKTFQLCPLIIVYGTDEGDVKNSTLIAVRGAIRYLA